MARCDVGLYCYTRYTRYFNVTGATSAFSSTPCETTPTPNARPGPVRCSALTFLNRKVARTFVGIAGVLNLLRESCML